MQPGTTSPHEDSFTRPDIAHFLGWLNTQGGSSRGRRARAVVARGARRGGGDRSCRRLPESRQQRLGSFSPPTASSRGTTAALRPGHARLPGLHLVPPDRVAPPPGIPCPYAAPYLRHLVVDNGASLPEVLLLLGTETSPPPRFISRSPVPGWSKRPGQPCPGPSPATFALGSLLMRLAKGSGAATPMTRSGLGMRRASAASRASRSSNTRAAPSRWKRSL